MSNVTFKVDHDEFWPFPTINDRYGWEITVDEMTKHRWRQTIAEFERTVVEITTVVEAQTGKRLGV